MNKYNFNITSILKLTNILSIISLLILIGVDFFVYKLVLNSSLFLAYFIIIVIGILTQEKKFLKFTPIILLALVAWLFWINKPSFTYNQAIYIIQNKENSSYVDAEISNIKMTNSYNIFTNKAYVINMEKDGQAIKYIFDPIDGKYIVSN